MDSNQDRGPIAGLLAKQSHRSLKLLSLYFLLYLAGIFTFLLIIADPFTMSTYFSDNSLLPGLVNREFSLGTEAEYYFRDLSNKLKTNVGKKNEQGTNDGLSLATSREVTDFIKQELDNFGLEVIEQNFHYTENESRTNGTNIYSIIRGERSTSSEAIVLCAPFKLDSSLRTNSMSSVALSLALAKYFSSKSYWAKDVIVLFVDRDNHGASAWLDSYYDVDFRPESKLFGSNKIYYDSLPDRSGPIQAAIVLELYGRQFTRVNVKIQGSNGQLPNLDLFNLIIDLATRESVTPYFHDKSLPMDLSIEDLYKHHIETAISFMKTQATMQSDGLHGLFLKHAIQSLTIEGPEHSDNSDRKRSQNRRSYDLMTASMLNVGRLIEGVFRSLNNMTERFNRSYYFYILVSLRRFTSIGYYMIAYGLIIAPLLIKAYKIYIDRLACNQYIGKRGILLLVSAWILSLLSAMNISLAMMISVVLVPILILI